jgi:hypothetical protein
MPKRMAEPHRRRIHALVAIATETGYSDSTLSPNRAAVRSTPSNGGVGTVEFNP